MVQLLLFICAPIFQTTRVMKSKSGNIFYLLCLFMAFISIVFSDDNPCHLNITHTSLAKKKILCIGTLNNDLMVVTDQLEIWEFKNGGMNNVTINEAINKLYFAKKEPVPLEEMFPKIVNNYYYKKLKKVKIPSCNTAVDREGRYLMLDSDRQSVTGLIWDVDKNIGFNGFYNSHDKKSRIRWISSNSLANFYAFSDANNTLSMVRYALCSDDDKVSDTMSNHGDMGEVFENGTCQFDEDPHLRKVCKKGTTDLYVQEFNSTEKCETINWKVFNGFIGTDDKIYLFGENDVITFPEKAYHHADQPVVFQKTPYNLIINCSVEPVPRKNATEKAPIAIGVIVGVSLILVICILLCLLCLVRTAIVKKRKKEKRDKKANMKGDIRSADMKGPGALSGVSQRSTSGLLSAKPLSVAPLNGVMGVAGSAASTGASRRSSFKCKDGSIASQGVLYTARSSNVPGKGSKQVTQVNSVKNMATTRSGSKASKQMISAANMASTRSGSKAGVNGSLKKK